MAFVKIATLCLGLLVLANTYELDENKEVRRKTFHSSHFDRLIEQQGDILQNVNGSAVVLKSNMPVAIQAKLATALTAIYQSTSDQLQRAQHFQQELGSIYREYWEVVINFDVITFYSQWYILLQINNDRVLGFGLQ